MIWVLIVLLVAWLAFGPWVLVAAALLLLVPRLRWWVLDRVWVTWRGAGIDDIAFATGANRIDLAELAGRFGVEPAKYYVGLGQSEMSVPAADEDIVYEHARCGGFPAESVSLVSAMIDPASGE